MNTYIYQKELLDGIKNFTKILIASILFLIITTPLHAQTNTCQRNTDFSGSAWVTQPSGSEFRNGQVIASTRGAVTYYVPHDRNTVILDGRSWNIATSQYSVMDLPKTPGAGVRIKWGGYWIHGAYQFIHSYLAPAGTLLSKNSNQNLTRGKSSKSSYIITFYYDYEIVVTDNKLYKGGKLIIESTGRAFAYTSHSNGIGSPAPCIGGTLDLLEAIKVGTTLPELPDPPTPTCASADLAQVAKLKPIIASQVAPYSSNRSGGTAGEVEFQLIGRRCPKGTTIKAYFTDNRSPSSTNNYLNSSHSDIGVRLYHKQSQTPIQFGPAPLGSTLPSRPAVIEGPVTITTTDMFIPITAQYVQLPSVAAGDVKAGSMKAAATVTFVYD
ncbi:fimbrial protein [Comamonas sp. GB3 AK4-5]|uniref:fimbrial protein n=1 Tax=Comamonas sp. GB3 AK4-5 TaxID=3231487 RepID=UPI00351E3B26